MSMGTPDFTTMYAPMSGVGPYRAADYFALPEGSRVELMRGWLVPMDLPTQDNLTPYYAAYRAVKEVVDEWINEALRCRDEISRISRRRLLIEVRPERERKTTRSERLERYARLHVEEYWFIDPVERYTLFHVLDIGRYVIHTGVDNRYQSPRLPEVEINLATFWKEVAERLPQA